MAAEEAWLLVPGKHERTRVETRFKTSQSIFVDGAHQLAFGGSLQLQIGERVVQATVALVSQEPRGVLLVLGESAKGEARPSLAGMASLHSAATDVEPWDDVTGALESLGSGVTSKKAVEAFASEEPTNPGMSSAKPR